jgi:site-specific DNA recombinase
MLSTIPRAAELCEERIALGLHGDPQACEEARVILRSLIPDRIQLSRKADGSLWAHCAFQPAALLATGSLGRGDVVCRSSRRRGAPVPIHSCS